MQSELTLQGKFKLIFQNKKKLQIIMCQLLENLCKLVDDLIIYQVYSGHAIWTWTYPTRKIQTN